MTTAAVAALAVGTLGLPASAGAGGTITVTFVRAPNAPAGTSIVIPIRVGNHWNGRAVGVRLTVTAPAWVKLSGRGCVNRPAGLGCTLPDIAAGAETTVKVTVKATHGGAYRLFARVAVKEIRIAHSVRSLMATTAFHGSIAPVSDRLAGRMTGVSWRSGCPVGLTDLRVVSSSFWGFDGAVHQGTLIVHRSAAPSVVRVLRRLFAARFPIRRMVPVDAYGADDFRSIEADNTSAFNCRPVAGTSRWSEHAYGRAIDLDPLENPYVSAGTTSHARSRRYLDRSLRLPGMVHAGDVVVKAFAAEGWGWGGTWPGDRDYQHFSASGR